MSTAGCGSANEKPAIGGGPYFVLRESPPSMGAGRESFDVLYVGADGLVQISEETGEGVIASLRQAHADTTSFLETLPAQLPSSTPLGSPQAGPNRVVEGRGALTRLVYRRADGRKADWSGPSDSVPASVSKLIQQARELPPGARLSTAALGDYVRASRMSPWVAREWRKAGILTTVTPDQLDHSPVLRDAVEHEERLIAVPSTENPYAAVGKVYAPLRDVKLSVGDDVFQIRSLVLEKRVQE